MDTTSSSPESAQFKRLLIVEDDPFQLQTLSALLRKEGFAVVGCRSFSEAAAQLGAGEFAVAILDLRLPDGDGTRLFETFQAEAAKTRIIVHTAFGSFQSAKKAVNYGIFAYVEKASDPAELIRQVHRAVEDYLAESLKVSERRYWTLMESANDAIFVADAETGMLVDANRKAQQLIGRSLEEIRRMHQSDLHPPDQRAYYQQVFQQQVAEGGGFTGDLSVVHRDGHTIPVEISGSVIEIDDKRLIQGIFHDLTERKAAEQKIKESQALYRSLVENLPQSVFRKDLEGRITFANEQFCRHLDRPREDILGRTDFDLYPPDLARKYQDDDRRVIESGETFETIEEHVPAKGGRIYVQVVKTPVYDSRDQIVGVQGIFWDVTERRQAETRLQEANARLRKALEKLEQTQQQVIQQERLRALGQMATGVGHDLNNALSPVLGYAELLLADPELSPTARQWASCIHIGAKDATAVVEQLQHFYRVSDAGAPRELVNLCDLVRQIPELTRPKWRDEAQQTGRHISLDLELESVPPVMGVAAELRQLLVNLVLNAVDALPSGGQIALRLRAAGQGVLLEVADTGIGMTDQQQRRCFEPFYTSKCNGSGLGLSVCHGIVQRHDGRIEIQSAPGRGTTFRIVLPCAQQTGGAAAAKVPRQSPLPRRRVLYIDDDARLRAVVRSLLEQLGQQVDVAEDGVVGLAKVKQGSYDVVITDLGMSGMDGRQVTRTIKQLRSELPVIMLTGWSERAAMDRADESERPASFIEKPPTLEKLRQALSRLADPSRPSANGPRSNATG